MTLMRSRTTRQPEHVLDERREHVPRLEVHERADEVEAVCRGKRDDDIAEGRIGLHQAVGHSSAKRPVHCTVAKLTSGNLSNRRGYAGRPGRRYSQRTKA